MIAMRDIEKFSEQVGREFGAQKVILFGSYANGQPTEDSDVDILVITPHQGHSVDTSVAIRMQLRPQLPLDLIVRTQKKIQQRIAAGDDFLGSILKHGKVLYEAHDN